jgi:flavodoxin
MKTMDSLVIVFSYHHKNTEKIAGVIAKALGAKINKTPQRIGPKELQKYSLIGFGSGIYDGKNHKSLLELADKLPKVNNRKAFIFSTCGLPAMFMTKEVALGNHSLLRDKLKSKGYTIADEFGCPGFNTHSFLRLFGGLNKGRPNARDLKNAEGFAKKLKGNAFG